MEEDPIIIYSYDQEFVDGVAYVSCADYLPDTESHKGTYISVDTVKHLLNENDFDNLYSLLDNIEDHIR